MLGIFLYLRIAFKVESLTFSIIGSKSKYWDYFPKLYSCFRGNVKVKLDLSNYPTKPDIKYNRY